MEFAIRLVIQEPQGAERGIIPSTADLTVGQAPANDIVLADPKAARVHARLKWEAAQWTLVDLNSASGTWVNGQRIQGPVILQPGDVIRISDSTLCVEAKTAATASTPPQTTSRPPLHRVLPTVG